MEGEENKKKVIKNTKPQDLKFIIGKVWEKYEITEKRRRNSFYYLFFTIAIYAFILINPDKAFKLPLLNVEVDLFVSMVISPLIISVVASSYLFSSAYSIVYLVDLIKLFLKYELDEENSIISLQEIYDLIKKHDLSSYFNPYLLPSRVGNNWRERYPRVEQNRLRR